MAYKDFSILTQSIKATKSIYKEAEQDILLMVFYGQAIASYDNGGLTEDEFITIKNNTFYYVLDNIKKKEAFSTRLHNTLGYEALKSLENFANKSSGEERMLSLMELYIKAVTARSLKLITPDEYYKLYQSSYPEFSKMYQERTNNINNVCESCHYATKYRQIQIIMEDEQ